jgi:hypothetical protein
MKSRAISHINTWPKVIAPKPVIFNSSMVVSFLSVLLDSGGLFRFLLLFSVDYTVHYHALNPDSYCENDKHDKNSKETESADF